MSQFPVSDKIELLNRHRKTCEICGSTSIGEPEKFCPIGRMLVDDILHPNSFVVQPEGVDDKILHPIYVLPAGPVRRWWRFWNWIGRALGRVVVT